MAAVLTTSMTLRIILSVRGTLVQGGSFALSGTTANSSSSRTTHIISTRSGIPTNISAHVPHDHTYTLDDMRSKPEAQWPDNDNQSGKGEILGMDPAKGEEAEGVKVTIDREVGYDQYPRGK